jgi:hypothetical protein
MSRVAIWIVVATMAWGSAASVICRSLCDPHAAAQSGCHPSAAVSIDASAAASSCATGAIGAGVAPPEKARTGLEGHSRSIALLSSSAPRVSPAWRHWQLKPPAGSTIRARLIALPLRI